MHLCISKKMLIEVSKIARLVSRTTALCCKVMASVVTANSTSDAGVS